MNVKYLRNLHGVFRYDVTEGISILLTFAFSRSQVCSRLTTSHKRHFWRNKIHDNARRVDEYCGFQAVRYFWAVPGQTNVPAAYEIA